MAHDDGSPMSFPEFGQAFAELVLVPEIIGQRLEALLPKEIEVREDVAVAVATARGHARVSSIDVATTDGDDLSTLRRMRALVEVNLSLRLRMRLGTEEYRVVAAFPLDLISRVVRPLNLVVDVEAPDPEEISVDISGGGRLKLAAKIGNLDDRVRGHVIRIIEDMVAQTAMHRTYDVVQLVHVALADMEVEPLNATGT